MGTYRKHSDADVLSWYEMYQDYRLAARRISEKFGVKHEIMLGHFRRLGLKLRPSGFRTNNCRGKNGEDVLRLRYLWFFKFLYKRRAARKGLEVTLTDDQFITLVTSSCHYCGRSYLLETRNVGRNKYINMLTVDRKDSKLGYTPENSVPSCKRCNTIKMDMTYNEFVQQVKAIVEHLKL